MTDDLLSGAELASGSKGVRWERLIRGGPHPAATSAQICFIRSTSTLPVELSCQLAMLFRKISTGM